MLELGIDEITIVLQITQQLKNKYNPHQFEWAIVAENIIDTFIDTSDFQLIFGDKIPESRPPQGYTNAYSFGNHNFYIAVAYHHLQMSMGIVVKFSAQSLDFYSEASRLKIYEFLQNIQSTDYTTRLSRIDLTVDYFDEGINVSTIYQNLKDKKIDTFREVTNKKTGELNYRRNSLKYSGYIKERDVPTIYMGSHQSKSFLRIYDKKREQIEKKGVKLDVALRSTDWVRFEGVFRNEFAHQLSEELLMIQNDDELANLIACTMLQKYRFMYQDNGVIDCETEYTQMLLDSINNNKFVLKSPSSRNFELAKNLHYLLFGSGVITTLYKIRAIWGDQGVSVFLMFMIEFLKDFKPNDDCRYWLRKNKTDYQKNFPNFDTFIKESVLVQVERGIDE